MTGQIQRLVTGQIQRLVTGQLQHLVTMETKDPGSYHRLASLSDVDEEAALPSTKASAAAPLAALPSPWSLSVIRSRITATKPMHVILSEDAEGHLERSLGLYDLLAIGIGGTVGSGT